MYNLDIFYNVQLFIDWCVIYYGIKNDLLFVETAEEYAISKLECDKKLSAEELELCWSINNKRDILEKIENIPDFNFNFPKKEEIAKNKIRIAILNDLRIHEKSTEILLQKVEMVYAKFGYPKDMDEVIAYMPVMDDYVPSEHTKEENQKRLLNKLDNFISKELNQYQYIGD